MSARKKRTREMLEAAAHKLYVVAEEVQKKVVPMIEQSPINDHVYRITHRVKRPLRIVWKIQEKQKNDPSFGIDNITDAFGLRVVTLFQNEIPSIVKILFDMIKHDKDFAGLPFVRNGLRELRIYTNRPEGDPYAIAGAVRELAESSGFEDRLRPPESKESGYSSVHLVVEVEVAVEHSDGWRQQPVLMEIQVRDIFEESWGEIDHKLRYKVDGKRRTDEELHQLRWLSNLNALKTHCDGCGQQAWIIQAHLPSKLLPMPEAFINKSIVTTQDAMAQLLTTLPADLHPLVGNIYQRRARVQYMWDPVARAALFTKTLSLLNELKKVSVKHHKDKTPIERPVIYHLDLERAFCMLAGDKQLVRRAAKIYERMLNTYKEDVVLHYRLGRAELALGRIDRAAELFKSGLHLIGTDTTFSQEHWIRAALPRYLSITYWAMSKKLTHQTNKRGKRLMLLRQACRYAEISYLAQVPDPMERVRTLNNLTYYVWQYQTLQPNGIKGKIDKPRLTALVDELVTIVDIQSSQDYQSLETLCQAFVFLRRPKRAGQAADQILRVLHASACRRADDAGLPISEIGQYLVDQERPAYDAAVNLQR